MQLILLVASLLCFIFAAIYPAAPQWNRVVAVGAACYVASLLLVGRVF